MSDEGTLNLTALLPELEIHSYTDAHSIEIRPPLVCKDGFTMQIMVGERYYCTPQENGLPNYTHYEIHIHEDAPELAEYPSDGPSTGIYGWIPEAVVWSIIERHGGIAQK